MASAARSPSIWLFSFCLTISSAVSRRDVRLLQRGLEVGVGHERHAARELRLCLATTTLAGTLGLFSMPVKNEAVIAEMSTAPASAVPIDAPSWVPVFWSPPTSPLFSSGTDETVTAPSWEAIIPSPDPASSNGQVTISGPTPTSSSDGRSTRPANSVMNPSRTTRRGDAFGRSLGTPTANTSRESDSGSSRTPVSTAEIPSATDRNSGTVKKIPAWMRNMEEEGHDPAAQLEVAQHRRVDQRALAALDPPVLPHTNRTSTTPPAKISQITGDSPSHSGASGFGRTNPHVPGLENAEHDRAEPKRGQGRADQVEPGAFLRRRVLHAASQEEDHQHDEDLPGEHPPPGRVGREQRRRPAARRATAIAPAAATSP